MGSCERQPVPCMHCIDAEDTEKFVLDCPSGETRSHTMSGGARCQVYVLYLGHI